MYAGGKAVVAQKCHKIGFFIPGYPTNFGCHGNKKMKYFELFLFFHN